MESCVHLIKAATLSFVFGNKTKTRKCHTQHDHELVYTLHHNKIQNPTHGDGQYHQDHPKFGMCIYKLHPPIF